MVTTLLLTAFSLTVAAANAAGAAGPEAPRNLVRNPGFEQVAPDGREPRDWRFAWRFTHHDDRLRGRKKQEPVWGVDTTAAHSGTRSFHIRVQHASDDGVLTQEDIAPLPGVQVYLVKAWVRTARMKNTRASVAVVALGRGGRWLGANYSVISVGENADWKEYAGFFQPPKGTRKLRLRLWLNMAYSGTGEVWFDDVRLMPTSLTSEPPIRYVEDRPAPPLRAVERRAGYRLFRRTWLDMIFPESRPTAEELDRPIEVVVTPGEYEPLTFCIRAIRPLRGVTVRFSAFVGPGGARIPASAVDVGLVRCLPRRGQARWGPFMDGLMRTPIYIAPAGPFDLASGTTVHVWATLHVPERARSGRYSGTAVVTCPEGGERTLPVRIDVLPFRLPEPAGVAFGMYSGWHGSPEAQDRIYADMRAHGMTTVGHCGNLGAKIAKRGDRVEVLFDGNSEFERVMAAYMKAGFPEPFVWLMGPDVLRWCRKQGPLDSPAFADAYRQVILRILERARRNRRPEIIFQPVDEPFEHTKRLPEARRCLEILKSIPGIRTEEDGPNGNPTLLDELYPLCDVLVLHDGPVLRRGHYDAEAWERFLERTSHDGKSVWFYNIDLTAAHPEVMRWGYGFGLWLSGASGMIEWAYQMPVRRGRPGIAYERPGCIIYRFPRWKDEPGGPTVGWEAIREGVDDYKYVAFLERLLDRPNPDEKRRAIVTEARKFLNDLRGRTDFRAHEGRACQGDWTGPKTIRDSGERAVSGSYKMANGWTFEDYDTARRRIARYITLLLGGD